LLLLCARPAWAYIEEAYSLGRVINDSSTILLMRVEQVDKQRNLIVYRKVQDIKGKHTTDIIKHTIGQLGFHPREWQTIMAWAEVGKPAVLFHNGGIGETCIENYWYQSGAGDWWNMTHAEPFFLRTYCGKPERLASVVAAMLQGREVTVPCMAEADKNSLHVRTGRIQRMKASLKITDHNPKRDFAEGGADEAEFRPVAGMAGFSHLLSLCRVSPGAAGVSPASAVGNGKLELCVFGANRAVVTQHRGTSVDELTLGLTTGARAASWADFDGDGKQDLLLATPAGLRLLRNDGKRLEDMSKVLPADPYASITAAAWLDYDGDGKPDILLADGLRGLRLLRNTGAKVDAAGQAVLGKWQFIGPFDNRARRGFHTAYPPEHEIDLKKQYVGKNGEIAAWREGNFQDGQRSDLRRFKNEQNNHCVVYLYREIESPGVGEMPISMGADDNLVIWFNGQRLYSDSAVRGCQPDQACLRLKLQPGKNTLLAKVCQTDGDFAFFFAVKEPPPAPGMPAPPPPPPQTYRARVFEDVSDAVGLGSGGVGAGLKGDCLVVADVNGDGRPDFLFAAGKGLLALNTPQGFVEAKNTGIQFQPGGVTPAFGDFDGDGKPDLVVPQRTACRLFHNEGNARFSDVTANAGDLAKPLRDARGAAWIHYGVKGTRPDLFVGCLKGPNRYFHSKGNGTFSDVTDAIGLGQRVFSTRAVAVVDLNNDKVPDVVFNNEGQDAVALLTSATWPTELAKLDAPPKPAVAQAPEDPPGVPGPKEAVAKVEKPAPEAPRPETPAVQVKTQASKTETPVAEAKTQEPKPEVMVAEAKTEAPKAVEGPVEKAEPAGKEEPNQKTAANEKMAKSGIAEAAPKPAWDHESEPRKTAKPVASETAESSMTPEQRQRLVLGVIVVIVAVVVVLYMARPKPA
jgi:hypothetical protein